MIIDEAIKKLKNAKKEGIKSIVLVWWEASAFETKDGVPFSDDDTWQTVAESIEGEIEWSQAQEDIQFAIDFQQGEQP